MHEMMIRFSLVVKKTKELGFNYIMELKKYPNVTQLAFKKSACEGHNNVLGMWKMHTHQQQLICS